jgi:protein TonB
LEEEWLADLGARAGSVSRLRFALGCCWATAVIARELGTGVRAAAATGNKTAVAYADPRPPFVSRRSIVVLLIVALHVLVIYGLAAGIVSKAFRPPTPPMDVVPVSKSAPPVEQPPPLNPKLWSFQLNPPPPLGPPVPPEETTAIQDPSAFTPPGGDYTVPPLAKPLSRVLGGPGAGFPRTDDFYPEASRRLEEKGVATLNVCVDRTGRLTARPLIAGSSGSVRLDEGALRLASAGSGHYRPTTENGGPVDACYPLRVRFVLKD